MAKPNAKIEKISVLRRKKFARIDYRVICCTIHNRDYIPYIVATCGTLPGNLNRKEGKITLF